ncbi:WecB/TagA/CpsF family glycosyltransferase [Roseivivax isoporae]|uniref:UDP-phosphate galactose phosphotransferase n=1 Tax=Roseivivax isoporae LMG 25204 TaxID=1449351 RepID=X7F823_9RHOB|nr:WecB/TagA/CpsF family glycosyltransferase [Roseivivax isoporae]ETX28229.1 UDP-phosphate galactose phosphotransferase [Roseivivax isoporae LMG 25204]
MKHADFSTLDTHHVLPAGTRRTLTTTPLFGLDLVDATAEVTIRALLSPGRRRVHFVNAHCINVAARDAAYARALRTGDVLLPDGIGIELAARMAGRSLTENLNGTDLTPRLLAAAARAGLSVFLFGGRPGTAEAAADRLCRDIPGLVVAGCRDGYAGAADPRAAIAEINASGADILIVAMGVPRQDTWLADHADLLKPRLTLGVGALLDFLAGNVARAPRPLRRARLEWAWRLAMEPRRMARRYVAGNAVFLLRAARHATMQPQAQALAKRALDLGLAALALVPLAPVFLLTALAVTLDSRGPVLFRQIRVGRDGQTFEMLKFRSMHVDAEARRGALEAQSDRSGLCFKSRSDPRVTRVGRILRRYSLDELPQILNVLRGDMAIVGPRPALPAEVSAYPDRARARLRVRPGITGLWQVSGRADIGFDKMIDMDLSYAARPSVLMDLVLIGLTVRAVLGGRGAY